MPNLTDAEIDALADRIERSVGGGGMILTPYLWTPPDFDRFEATGSTVWFCEVVPIFAAERELIVTWGFASFEAILREDGTRFWDRNRASHVH